MSRRVALLVLLPALAAGAVLLILAGGVPEESPVGLPEPGRLTTWGLPVLNLLDDLLAVLVVGLLLVPLLTMLRPDEEVRGRPFRALWAVRGLALAWALVTAGLIVLTVSDQFAVPVWRLSPDLVGQVVTQSDQGLALFLQLLLVSAVGVASRWVLKPREVGAVLALALVAVAPAVLTGHAAASGSHDTAVVSMLVHVWGVVLWMGGVVALVWHLGADDERRALAMRRFSPVAAWCFALVGISGAVNAAVRLGSAEALVSTGYGAGVVTKMVALAVVGVVAANLRRRVRSRCGSRGRDGRRARDRRRHPPGPRAAYCSGCCRSRRRCWPPRSGWGWRCRGPRPRSASPTPAPPRACSADPSRRLRRWGACCGRSRRRGWAWSSSASGRRCTCADCCAYAIGATAGRRAARCRGSRAWRLSAT